MYVYYLLGAGDSTFTFRLGASGGNVRIPRIQWKRGSFVSSVAFLLQFDPVVAKNVKAKGSGVNVLATFGETTPGGVTLGRSGVELRWHKLQKFRILSKEQKAELSELNKTNNF